MLKPPRATTLAALLVLSAALAVYARTMYPGLVSFGDSPKLQFVGRIWGTPHNPGYPLYVVVSHLFGLLPIGTLAYRINLMSAVCGAAAAGLLVVLVAQLTGRVWAGIAAAAGLALGRVFWSQAIVAEVYTLGAALLLATLCLAVRWTASRRTRDLLAAVLMASIAVGNHLTIVMFAPGLVTLVLMSDWKRALRPKTLAVMAALVAAGLSQYLLIIYFTIRHPPYLESSARNVSELLPIVAGAQFKNRFGHFGWLELVTSRSAQLFRILVDETGLWGLCAAGIGLVVLARRQPPVAAGLAVSAVCVWTFVLGYDIADPQVFLIPVFVVVWTLVGVAAGALIAALARAGRGAALAGGVLASTAVATTLYASNHRANDHHKRTYEASLMDAVFRELPARAVVVWGAFSEQLTLQYKLYGEGAGAARAITGIGVDPALLKGAAAANTPIYALPQARDQLSRSGFVFEPVALLDMPLKAFLATAPRGLLVAVAGPGLGAALPLRGPSLPEIGATTRLFTRPRDGYAVIGWTGARTGAIEEVGGGRVEVRLGARQPFGAAAAGLPEELRAVSSEGGVVTYGGRTIVAASQAAVIAAFTPAGQLVRASTLDPRALRLALEGDAALFRVAGIRDCRDIANAGWLDLSALTAAGRLAIRVDNYRPFDSQLWLVLGRDAASAARLRGASGPAAPRFTTQSFSRSDTRGLQAALLAAGFSSNPLPASNIVEVVHLEVNDNGEFELLTLDLVSPPRFAVARGTADLNNPKRLTVCAGDSM